MSNYDDAMIILIRDITLNFVDKWGRVPSALEIKGEMSGKRGS